MLPNVEVPPVPLLREAGVARGQIQVGYQRVESFHKLIVDQLPYGQIDPTDLVQGLIEFDGPDQDPPNKKAPLQWNFGGEAYEVRKAIRVQYSYPKYLDTGPGNATGSLFIGYVPDDPWLLNGTLKAARATLKDFAKHGGDPSRAQQAIEALTIELDNHWSHHAARAARQVYRSAVSDTWALLRDLPQTVTPVACYVDTETFDAFVYAGIPSVGANPGVSSATLTAAALKQLAQKQPQALADAFIKAQQGEAQKARIVSIYYDGPATDYNSQQAFPYTVDTLFNEPDKYNQLLWWYFGGRAFHITKAMLLAYVADASSGLLLVGYQGPSPH